MIDEQTKEALARIARTDDGQLLYRFLHQEVCRICSDQTHGALRRHEGRRSFASDLMTHMGEGTDVRRHGSSSGGGIDNDDGRPKRRQSVREWIASQPGWYDEPGDAADGKPADAGPGQT